MSWKIMLSKMLLLPTGLFCVNLALLFPSYVCNNPITKLLRILEMRKKLTSKHKKMANNQFHWPKKHNLFTGFSHCSQLNEIQQTSKLLPRYGKWDQLPVALLSGDVNLHD